MTRVSSETSIQNDGLICPITLELFRDPVIAGDGHAYERAAITRWILENGNSPLTRQSLRINDLRPDDRLKRRAARRRNSTVSYNARNNIVALPPLHEVPSTTTAEVAPNTTTTDPAEETIVSKCLTVLYGCCCLFIFAAPPITGFVVALIFSLRASSSNSSGIIDFF